jgi:sodium/proline symporter
MEPDSKVLDVVSYAWAGLGASIGPAILVSLYWKKMTSSGALAGIVVGGLTVIVWSQLEGGIFNLYALVPGFIFSLVAIALVSLLDRKSENEVVVSQFNLMEQQVSAATIK